jgi:hypothetical protein
MACSVPENRPILPIKIEYFVKKYCLPLDFSEKAGRIVLALKEKEC